MHFQHLHFYQLISVTSAPHLWLQTLRGTLKSNSFMSPILQSHQKLYEMYRNVKVTSCENNDFHLIFIITAIMININGFVCCNEDKVIQTRNN